MTEEEVDDLVHLGNRIAERAVDVNSPFAVAGLGTQLAFESFNLGLQAACMMLGQHIASLNDDDEVQNEENGINN